MSLTSSRLTLGLIIEQYYQMMNELGKEPKSIDISTLEGIISNIYQSFGGVEFYKTPIEKASRLYYAIATTQVFGDGNKRMAVISLVSLLKVYNKRFNCKDNEIIQKTLDVANKYASYGDVLDWVTNHTLDISNL